jgi:nanoRNase/pAp phosphatase (c-di-AMP/oligoRNAs hydrolase)
LEDQIKKLGELIESSNRILIVTHMGPDPDAISCTSFTLSILKTNFPQKEISANICKAEIADFYNYTGVSSISTESFEEIIKEKNPDLIIALDVSTLKLLSKDEDCIAVYKKHNCKLAFIDHHLEEEKEKDVFILMDYNSCAEAVYEVFADKLGYTTYPNYFNDVLLGIVDDTGSFSYLDKNIENTFDLAKKLVLEGGNIDKIVQILGKKSLTTVKMHAEYLKNFKSNGEYSYTFLSDGFLSSNEYTDAEITKANKQFVQLYLKNTDNVNWGFTVRRNTNASYSVSFRAQIQILDTTVFTTKLGGNGHKSSSGGFVSADNVEDALKQIIDVIEKYKEEAYANK